MLGLELDSNFQVFGPPARNLINYSKPDTSPFRKAENFFKETSTDIEDQLRDMATGLTVGGWFVSAFVDNLVDKISTYAIQQHGFQSSLHDDLKKLWISLIKVRAVIVSAEKKPLKEEEGVLELLRLLKEAAYDADDLLSESEYEQLKLKVEGGENQASGFLPSALNFASLLYDSNDTTSKIREIQDRLDSITANLKEVLEVLGDAGGKQQAEIRVRQETSSLLTEPVVFGRDEERDKLVELLFKSDDRSDGRISVLPIVGIGGVGKTTLAQFIYNDPKVKEHFQLRIWVCVSDPFDVKRLTKEMAESVSGERRSDLTSLNQLQLMLEETISTKRFLIVLDDVWNEDKSKWEKLCAPFRSASQGSKILVSTRSQKVSDTMGVKDPFYLNGLSSISYWSFFKKCAFGYENSEKYPKLEAIGKVIADRLMGSPLAAKTLGGLLNSKLDAEHWRSIMESEIWELQQGENDILPILRLSYQYLPACLKQCFAYCSLFPKDFHFNKISLIEMWMTQGLIRPKGSMRMEDLGSEYFNDLLCMSFFQQHSLLKSTYVMHDLLHDLAQSVSVDYCFRIEEGKSQNIPSSVLHLSVCIRRLNLSMLIDMWDLCRYKKLRTLLFIYGYGPDPRFALDNLLKELINIRVMDLGYLCMEELPHSISNLKQLRYLDISRTNIVRFPESSCRLYNLQVLKLKPYLNVRFPRWMRNLINLRKLDASENSAAEIYEVGKLTSLQELSLFKVGKEPGRLIGELRDMTELHGRLCISNLENIDSKEEASQAVLSNKKYLNELCFIWVFDKHALLGIDVPHVDVIEFLQPHSNLKELQIISYRGVMYPSWLDTKSLPNLESIFLSNCKSLEKLPSLGHWPYLRVMRFGCLNAVRQISNLIGFPVLEHFSCWKMPEWEEWSSADASPLFPFLRYLSIKDCPKLRRVPSLPFSLINLRLVKVGLDELTGAWVGANNRVSHGSNSNFRSSSLSIMYIKDCPNLRSLEEFLMPNYLLDIKEISIINCGELSSLPVDRFKDLICLEYLELRDCPKLVQAAGIDFLLPPSLKKVILSSCGNLYMSLLGCLRNLTSLSTLKMIGCPHITSLQKESLHHLTSLEDLTIQDFADLRSLETIQCLASLKSLTILECPGLTVTLSQNNELGNGLSSLCSLCVDDTSLVVLRLLGGGQTSLQVLKIHCSQRLALFADGEEKEWLGNITSLHELCFKDCHNLQSLPPNLKRNSSLLKLKLEDCPELMSLPENGLPGSLKELILRNCHPDLKERCRADTGADWPKIAHVRKIYF